MPIGIPELLVVLVIVLLVLGPKRLPGLGRSLGGGIRNFKDAVRGGGDGDGDRPAALQAPPEPEEAEPLTGEVVPERRT
jgi:sec-independent protein translocase protein TatA